MTQQPEENPQQPSHSETGQPDYQQPGPVQGQYPHYPSPPQAPQPPQGHYPGAQRPAYPPAQPPQGGYYGCSSAPAGDYPYPGGPAYGYGYQPQPPGQGSETAGLVLGIIGLVNAVIISPFLWITGPLSLVIGLFGIWQAGKADRGHANGTPGRVMGWINTCLGGLYLLVVTGLALLILFAALTA